MRKPDIREYLDYREYLRDAYAFAHAGDKAFNYAAIIKRLGLKSQGHITSIFNGQRNIPERLVEPFAEVFGLSRTHKSYFKALVAYNQARNHIEKDAAFKRLVAFHRKKQVLDPDVYRYFSHWYNPVIRELVELATVSDSNVAQLAKRVRPPLSPGQVRKSLALLGDLGLVQKDSHGVYRRVDTILSTGKGWQSVIVHKYQRSAVDLAKEALDGIDKDERDISTLTLSCSHERMPEMRRRIEAFRKDLLAMAANDHEADQVFQCNIQLFPVSTRITGE